MRWLLSLLLLLPSLAYAASPIAVQTRSDGLSFKDGRTGLRFEVPGDYDYKIQPATAKRPLEVWFTHKTRPISLRVRLDLLPKRRANIPNLKLFGLTISMGRAASTSDYKIVTMHKKWCGKLGVDYGQLAEYYSRESKMFCCEQLWILFKEPRYRYVLIWLNGESERKGRKLNELALRVLKSWRW